MNNNKLIEYPGPEKTGRFIRELRISHNLTQENLGKEVYVTRKAVSKWENGICYPSIDIIPRLADLFGISLEELLSGEFKEEESISEQNSINFIIKMFRNRYIKTIISFVIAIAVFCLLIFFFENYNATKIYNVYYEDNYVYIKDGIIISTRAKQYYNFGSCRLDFKDMDENTDAELTIYLKNEDNTSETLQTYKLNNVAYHNNIDYKELTTKNLNDKLDKLYMKISYINNKGELKEYDIHLNADLSYQSNDIYNFKTRKVTNELKVYNDLSSLKNIPTINTEKNDEYILDLSFLFNMSKKEMLKKYDNNNLKINNIKYYIKFNDNKIMIFNTNLRLSVDFNENRVYYVNYELSDEYRYKINHDKVNIKNKETYNLINDITDKLKTI